MTNTPDLRALVERMEDGAIAFALEAAEELEHKAMVNQSVAGSVPAIVASERADAQRELFEAEARRWQRLASAVRLAVEAAAALTTLQHRVAEMEAALEIIERGDEPRPIGVMWRDDAKPSKNDRCVHSHWMYEDCGQCVAEFARSTLKDRGEGR